MPNNPPSERATTQAEHIIVTDPRTPFSLRRGIAVALDTARAEGFTAGAVAMQNAAAERLLSPDFRMQFVLLGPRCIAVGADQIRAIDPAKLQEQK